jgi:hypothetical protein
MNKTPFYFSINIITKILKINKYFFVAPPYQQIFMVPRQDKIKRKGLDLSKPF